MKTETILKRMNLQQPENKKARTLRELSALLTATPNTRKTARSYIENAINYIEKH